MKLLFIHVDYFKYQVREKTELAEKIEDFDKEGSIDDSLILLLSVEEKDEKADGEKLADRALDEIKDIVSQIKVKKIVLFPFAHLSESLSSPDYAVSVIEKLEIRAKNSGFSTLRVPFGWYKEFEFKSKGHPLSVLSRKVHASS